MCSFYGCILAGMVPVPIEVPVTRRDAGSQQIGFLLGSCGVTLALTSDACYKGLPKNANGEVISFKVRGETGRATIQILFLPCGKVYHQFADLGLS